MQVLRTPDERFAGLPDFPFAPHYVEVPSGEPGTALRVHHLDEGPADAAQTVVLLHGEPSWCYLYRHMVPLLVAEGFRVVAPDLVGFGRSDKPAARTDYTYARHVDWLRAALFDELGLDKITLFCQDWGGMLGLRLVAEHPERFARVVAANTALPTGDEPVSEAFLAWQQFSQEAPELPVGAIVRSGTVNAISPEVEAAYDAPFPNDTYQAGARQFPALVPTAPEDPAHDANVAAWQPLSTFARPFLCAFSDQDPITKGSDRVFIKRVPGAAGQPHRTVAGAGHFLQEDRAAACAETIIDFVGRPPR